MEKSRPDKVFYGCMPALGVWPVRNRLPIVRHGLADMLPVLGAFGPSYRGLANLVLVFVGEFPPLSFVLCHCLPGVFMPASTNKYDNPRKKEKRSSR